MTPSGKSETEGHLSSWRVDRDFGLVRHEIFNWTGNPGLERFANPAVHLEINGVEVGIVSRGQLQELAAALKAYAEEDR